MNGSDFDFRQVSEEKEELDFNELIPCPHCKKPISKDSTMCYYCGEEAAAKGKSLWIIGVAVVLLVVFIAFILIR